LIQWSELFPYNKKFHQFQEGVAPGYPNFNHQIDANDSGSIDSVDWPLPNTTKSSRFPAYSASA